MPSALARTIAVLWLLFVGAATALAQDASSTVPTIELSSESGTWRVTAATLASLPRFEQKVAFQTSRGTVESSFEGVLLWDVLKSAGAFREAGDHPELRKIFVVTGRDGYSIAFSMGEINPLFGNKAIMLAERADGQPLPPRDGLRLVVPGDQRGARSVRDVASIQLR